MLPAIAATVTTFGRCSPKKKFDIAFAPTVTMPASSSACAYCVSMSSSAPSCPMAAKSGPIAKANGTSTSSQYPNATQSPAQP